LKLRIISIVALVAVLCSMGLVSMNVGASSLMQATPDAAKKSGVVAKVIAEQLSVRSLPNIRATTLKVLKAGEAVDVIGKTNNGFWYQVNTSDNLTGWVASAYVVISTGKEADVPVIDASVIPDKDVCAPVAVNGRVNSVDGLSVRATPSNTSEKLTVLPAGSLVTIIGQNTAGTWYLITTQDKKLTGWVGAAYVFVTNKAKLAEVPFVDAGTRSAATLPPSCTGGMPEAAGTEAANPPASNVKGKVNVASLNVRANPSTDADILKKLNANDAVTLLAQNQNEQWLQVETADGIIGWVGSAYITLTAGKLADVPKITPAPVG